MPVADQLHLDVSRVGEVALAVHRAVAERRLGLARGGLERVGEVLRTLDDAHPAPAAASGRLDEQREAELGRVAGRKGGDACVGCDPLGLELVTTAPERVGAVGQPT